MRKYLLTSLFALATAPALAGGVERSNQSMAILFEQGNYLELGVSHTRPSVSGVSSPGWVIPAQANQPSGNMAQSFWSLDMRFKGQINEQLSYAFIVDEPIGANVFYPAGTGYPAAGSNATIRSTALTGVMRYAFDGGFSVYGGLRGVRTSGRVELTAGSGYSMSTNTDTAYGYLVGVAYERPEIAARVSLTYNSRIKHTFDVMENNTPSLPFSTTIPESLHLEFQTGIMEDTLLFGSVRWVKWTDFDITPVGYAMSPNPITGQPNGSLVSYDNNTITYTLGVGRRFNENWSGAFSVGYEKKQGTPLANLGPTDGFMSVGLGATYTVDNVRISGGVQYRRLGSGTKTAVADGGLGSRFSGNSAVSAGLRVGFSF